MVRHDCDPSECFRRTNWPNAINPFCVSIYRQRKLYTTHYLPWAIKTGRNARPLMTVYWEERFEQKVDELRKELNIELLPV